MGITEIKQNSAQYVEIKCRQIQIYDIVFLPLYYIALKIYHMINDEVVTVKVADITMGCL